MGANGALAASRGQSRHRSGASGLYRQRVCRRRDALFHGHSYRFTINGLGVGGFGAAKIKATGDVYQLARASDLEGLYGQVRLGWALASQGDGRLWLQNDKGVVLRLRTKREGLMLAAGADAVRIQLR